MKKIAIIQSNYIPWKGYFDLIAAVDEFVLFDDVQYTKGDWRNRNQIKTQDGLQWLTVPVIYSFRGKHTQKICETMTRSSEWCKEHWSKLERSYNSTPYFTEIKTIFEPLYQSTMPVYLSEINRLFIDAVCHFLEIKTKISHSWDYSDEGSKTGRLVNICLSAGATEYLSGPAAKNYINEQEFAEADIHITWKDYGGYPDYKQPHGTFCHNVSILDLLFCTGQDAPQYIWGWREKNEDTGKHCAEK